MADENNLVLSTTDRIKDKIYTLRGMQVMFDADLAELYNVETKQINRAVKRNSERFPDDFMFQISLKEFDTLKSQIVTSNTKDSRFQFGTSKWNQLKLLASDGK